jgi:cyclic pyranopterin phosphate synthase
MADDQDSGLGGLTHFDGGGRARMVDVGLKPETQRSATAGARLRMEAETLERIEAGKMGKGDVLAVARLAAISSAKSTSTQIPLCHPVRITRIDVEFELVRELPGIEVRATVAAYDRTGPEMEAMCAASTAALTVYDMCKAVDRSMEVLELRLLSKSGGKSGEWTRGGG